MADDNVNVNDSPLPESGPGDQPVPEEKRFTQAEVDRIIKQRLDERRSKFADYDELKAKASKWAEYEEAQKSELQKQQEAREKLETEVATLRYQNAYSRLENQAIAEAMKQGVAQDMLPLVAKMMDLDQLDLDKPDTFDKVPEYVKAMLERFPRLKDTAAAQPAPASQPRISAMNPANETNTKSGYVAPILRNRRGGNPGFEGFVVEPPGGGKK